MYSVRGKLFEPACMCVCVCVCCVHQPDSRPQKQTAETAGTRSGSEDQDERCEIKKKKTEARCVRERKRVRSSYGRKERVGVVFKTINPISNQIDHSINLTSHHQSFAAPFCAANHRMHFAVSPLPSSVDASQRLPFVFSDVVVVLGSGGFGIWGRPSK